MISAVDSQNTNSQLPFNALPSAGATQQQLSKMLIEGS